MYKESRWSTRACLIAGIVPILVLVGCGGAETPESASVSVATGASISAGSDGTETYTLTASQETDESVRVTKPCGTDEVYRKILQALDSAYSNLGSPPADSVHLDEVRDMASKQLAGVAFEWPPGTSYSLAVVDDRVAVYIDCNGQGMQGAWAPGGEIKPSS